MTGPGSLQRLAGLILLTAVLVLAPSGARAGLQEDLTRGYTLIDQWRIQEADAWAARLLETYPRSGDVHFLKGRVEFYKGDYEEALRWLKKVDDSEPLVREFKGLVERTHEATRGFVTRETEHFRIRFTDGPTEILIPYAEEVLERSYSVLGRFLDYFPREKVLIEIYPDREPFSRISPLTLKDIMTSGTVALCKYRRIMIISPESALRGYNWMDTLSHEYTHYLLSSASHNNVPLWLHEGIAKYLEGLWRRSDHLTPIMETVLASGLKNDYLVRLEDMMPSLAKLKSAEDVQLAYAEVLTMVEYMVQLKGREVIPAIVRSLREGDSFEQALDQHLGMTLDTFQQAWKRHMQSQKLRSIPGLRVLKFEFKKREGTGQEREAVEEGQDGLNALGGKQARDLALLGDILKERRFVNAAIVEYEKAIQQSRSLSPILYNKLAGTLMEVKQYGRARELLHTSLDYYPEFPTTLNHLGELYFHLEDYPRAEEYLQRAVRMNPFNPFLHQRLIELYTRLGQPEKRERQERLYAFLK